MTGLLLILCGGMTGRRNLFGEVTEEQEKRVGCQPWEGRAQDGPRATGWEKKSPLGR